MDVAEYEQYNRSVPFPPANFQIWPTVRIMALVTDALLIVIVALLWAVTRKVFSGRNLDYSAYNIVNQFKLWGFWTAGLDTIKFSHNALIVSKYRGLVCSSYEELSIPLASVVNANLERRGFFSLGLLWALLAGCLCGTWLHFIPCIWWTCDWGYFDGQGFRLALWGAAWVFVFLVLADRYRVVDLVLHVKWDSAVDKLTTYSLAIGEGVAREEDDPTAVYDLELIKRALYNSERVRFRYVHDYR